MRIWGFHFPTPHTVTLGDEGDHLRKFDRSAAIWSGAQRRCTRPKKTEEKKRPKKETEGDRKKRKGKQRRQKGREGQREGKDRRMPSEEHKRRKTQARRHKRRKAQAEREKITRDPVNKTYPTTPQRGDARTGPRPVGPPRADQARASRATNADRFGGERPHKSARRSARQAGRQGSPRSLP